MVRKQAPKMWDVVMVFAGLSVVFIVLAVLAQWLFTGNGFMYTILISLGAAIFGAGLAFFLLEVSEIQRARMVLASRVSIFVALAVVFLVLVLVAQNLLVGNPLAHTIFVSIGAATFGGGLTFFLVDMFKDR